MTPACWIAAGVSSLIALVWLWSVSWPGGLGLEQVALELAVLVAGLWWVVLVSFQLAARSKNRSVRRRAGASWRVRGTAALVVTGALWVLAVGLVAADAPLRVRFELSRSAFDAAATAGELKRSTVTASERAEADRSGNELASFESPGRLGLYPPGRIFVFSDSVSVEPASPTFSIGWFEYFPDETPSWWGPSGEDGGPQRLSLGDGWWAMWYPALLLD